MTIKMGRFLAPVLAISLGSVFTATRLPGDNQPGAGSCRVATSEPAPGYHEEPIERIPYDPKQIQATVAFWENRVKTDPEGAIALRELAGAYLARQRETGENADAVRAEAAARQSLKILPRHNAIALNRLSRSLLAQHRFPEALDLAKRPPNSTPRPSVSAPTSCWNWVTTTGRSEPWPKFHREKMTRVPRPFAPGSWRPMGSPTWRSTSCGTRWNRRTRLFSCLMSPSRGITPWSATCSSTRANSTRANAPVGRPWTTSPVTTGR